MAITITLIVAAFAAGYLLRGLLAVALNRKLRPRPLALISDDLLHGLADIADRYPTRAAGEAGRVLLAELRQRNQAMTRPRKGHALSDRPELQED